MGAAQIARETLSESVGRYKVGRQLAVGGMGIIFLAFDVLARKEVAYKRLKVSNESARPRLTALFEREYNALRQLKHPNIVEVYDYGLDAEGPFYTMELLAGQDLAAAAPVSLVDACRLMRDVASALALLHARRLVHRDVTPANVRIAQDGRAKLIDFGALSEFGLAREIVGTPAFIAPECLSGEPLDARTDLFALGGVAYWALTRRHAYPARSIGELMDVWEIPVSPPSSHVAELPREVDELVLSLLERDPVARPPSAAHVIERLTALGQLATEPDEQRVAYSYLLHPPLVGRGQVLEQLRRFTSEAANGEGRSTLIESAAGLGRSALLDQVAVDAQQSGANVLRFSPSGKRDAGLSQSVVRFLRALFPELASTLLKNNPLLVRETRAPLRAALSPGDVTQQRSKLVAAIQACVEEMSRRVPLTILVDDVHHADPESLAILASLARVTPRHPLLLVLSQEERATGSDVSALSDLRAASTTLSLRPLVEKDVDALVLMVFGDVPNAHRLARYLHAQSGGNPGQCMDLCRLLLSQHEIRYSQGTFALPFDPRGDALGVGAALELTRLTDLSEHALALVRLLSLHDQALSCGQAALASGLGLTQILAAAEELSARGLARLDEQDVALSSGSMRSALRGSLSTSELKQLHLALGRSIRESADLSLESKLSACHHLLCAGEDDEAIALVWEPLRRFEIPLGSTAACVPVLEQLLSTLRKRGHPDAHCSALLVPLVFAGYWGNLASSRRNRDAAFSALSYLTGIGLAKRLGPRLGTKLALFVGLLCGVFRYLTTPKAFRPPSFGEAIQRFVTIVTMSTAEAASAFEPEAAVRIAALLDPMEAMKPHTPGRVAREFAVATAEIGCGMNARCAKRYTWVMDELRQPGRLFDDTSTEGFIDGCIHGRAQAEVTSGAPDALRMAEELGRRHPFFRPHVETIKMTFHGYRGERELADFHRKQCEVFALQGGLSWSAFTTLSIRTAYIAMVSQDTLGVLQAGVELERLSSIAPNLIIYRDLCRAYVSMTRGQPDPALATYEQIAALPHAILMPAWEIDCAFHAEALTRVGRLEEAKRVCEEAIAVRKAQGSSDYAVRIPTQVLAMVEAKLGDLSGAKERLNRLAAGILASEAPLPIGALRRDQARIALLERDGVTFEKHFEGMVEAFRSTKNPVLIQQCRRLLAEAEKSGVVTTPSWEKHELMAPANTQDLMSQAPEVTEMVETYS